MTLPINLRYRLEYAGFRAIQAAVAALPLEAASRWSGASWRLIAPRLYRQKRVLNNLALAYPGMPLDERERIAADMWENLGRTFAESFRIRKIVEEGRIEFESQAQLDEMIRGGRGVVCGLHLGSWGSAAF